MVAVSLALLLRRNPPQRLWRPLSSKRPRSPGTGAIIPSPGQRRAVVLIQGLYMNPLKKDGMNRPACAPGRSLVAHSSTAWRASATSSPSPTARRSRPRRWPTCRTWAWRSAGCGRPATGDRPRRLSAGGPDRPAVRREPAGVRRHQGHSGVSPNAGSSWAAAGAAGNHHGDFLASLTKDVRQRALKVRGDLRIPAGVEFACIVGTGGINGDGLVSLPSQWSEDLQRQGIPAYPLAANHWLAMRSAKGAELLANWSAPAAALGCAGGDARAKPVVQRIAAPRLLCPEEDCRKKPGLSLKRQRRVGPHFADASGSDRRVLGRSFLPPRLRQVRFQPAQVHVRQGVG